MKAKEEKLVKEQSNEGLTADEAKAPAEKLQDGGELSDETLDEVAGGTGKGAPTRLKRYFGN